MIRFTCACGKVLQARDENAGMLVACPICKQQMRVPAPPDTAVQPDEPPPESVAASGSLAGGQAGRLSPRPEPDIEEGEGEERPRRREQRELAGSSGKAIASLVLGILSLCGCTCLTGLPSILFGLLALRDIGRAGGLLTGKAMAIIGMVLGGLGTLCWPVVGIPGWYYSQDAGNRLTSSNNLHVMGIAMHNYNATYGNLPPAGFAGAPGQPQMGRKPLLSWRVALLPYLEQQNLYNQFKLDEPWDGPNNKKLLARMPKIYRMPGDTKTPPDHTFYQVFVGPGTAFEKGQVIRIGGGFPDGTANTILIVEAAQAVPWTKPEDLPFDPNKPLPPRGGHFRSGFQVLLADGSVRQLKQNVSETTLKAAITRNGGEILGLDW